MRSNGILLPTLDNMEIKMETQFCPEFFDALEDTSHSSAPPPPQPRPTETRSLVLLGSKAEGMGETAAELATRIAQRLQFGTDAIIDACAMVHEGFRRFGNEPGSMSQFQNALIAAGVITANDVALRSGSKLSMLRKIGEYAEVLRHPRISGFVAYSGYSVLYDVARLYAPRGGDLLEVEELAKELKECVAADGTLGRKHIDARIRAKQTSKPAPLRRRVAPNPGDVPAKSIDPVAADLLLLTPRPKDIERLAKAYAAPDALLNELSPVRGVTETAIAIAFAKICDLSIVAGVLLPACGFQSVVNVLLVREPERCEITDQQIVVIAKRNAGAVTPHVHVPDGWFSQEDISEPRALTGALISFATTKRHAFAADSAEGWDVLVGDASWASGRH